MNEPHRPESHRLAKRQTPNAKRQTPNAKRQTPNAKRQTPNASGGFGGDYEPVRGAATSSTPGFGSVRVNLSLRYESPTFSGLRASLLYGTGETVSVL